MKYKFIASALFILTIVIVGWAVIESGWMVEKYRGYTMYYQQEDTKHKNEYQILIDSGMQLVKSFFGEGYKNSFTIALHPNRASLDSTWRKDWNMPTFKSECWMVASGVASRIDMIAPAKWDQYSCEHHYADKEKTGQLITHELFHVYHGQLNISPDFSDVNNIDWFVEGLATYASGQCDTSGIAAIKKMIAADKVPASLDKFWTGPMKYGLSGSVVLYIDHTYGRNKLKELLRFNTLNQILEALGTTETDLIRSWKSYIEKLS